MRFALLFLFGWLVVFAAGAQQLKYTAFTVNDGLPSNYVYRCIEDNRGFLWVATDAGIARFDGKHFQVFTTQDGLPDNEVLAVVKENNGTIWANCFKQRPAYFDEVKNRFINAKDDSTLAQMKENTGNMFCFPLQKGGIMFFSTQGTYVLKNKKLNFYPNDQGHGFLIIEYENNMQLELKLQNLKKRLIPKIELRKAGKFVDSVTLRKQILNDGLSQGTNEDKFYLLDKAGGKCYIYSDFGINPLRFKTDSVTIPESYNNFEFTDKYFYLLANSGKAYLFNKHTLKLDEVVSGNYLINSIFKDHNANMWVSTIDKGLIVYKKKQFGHVELPHNFTGANFLSISRKLDGTLLAGNYYGQVVEVLGKKAAIHSIPKHTAIARERKILLFKNQVITFSEEGVFSNFRDSLCGNGKTGIAYNDSVILIGQSYGLRKLNLITHELSELNVLKKRVTALAPGVGGWVYYGSTDGLYKYNYAKNTAIPLSGLDPLLTERITAICVTNDGLTWVATSGSGVVVLKNDRVLLHISENDGLINNASRSIATGSHGQVWVGTSGGISVVQYHLTSNGVNYSINNLTKDDGLTNNVVNEMIYYADTVYAATSNGISIIPARITIPKFNIPVQLTGMSVNQRDTILSPVYKLRYYQQNIQMKFAGIELGGHFKNLQYTIDGNKSWINLETNTLIVQLNSGAHTVRVRAVDANRNISNKILTIKFDIETPFWKAIWFWITLAAITQVFIIYYINRRQKKRKEARLAKEIANVQTASLEQQAFTSLMNPHFMFNALNSIQHYINLQDRQNANRYLSDFASLIRKNFEAAQLSFISLEQEIENIKIYLRLEQMRFSEQFTYTVAISDQLDTDEWMLPTMILQPLLENALLHGIVPSNQNGVIFIDLKEKYGNLLIVITDNGIGIANSMALKRDHEHKSRGMELIKKRVTALSRFGKHAITINMGPVFADERNPGNQVVLFIPHELYSAWQQAQKR